jgi:hypothetical protein
MKNTTDKQEQIKETNSQVATKKPVSAPTTRYRMIPVDHETHARLMALCAKYGFGQRGQGAMMRRLINIEFEKISADPTHANL